MTHDLSARIETVLALDAEAPAIESRGTWTTWGQLASTASAVHARLDEMELPPGAPVGIVLRNQPAVVGAVLGTLLGGRTVISISPSSGDDGVVREIEGLEVEAVAALDVDWEREGVREAVGGLGAATIRLPAEAGAGPVAVERDASRPARPGTVRLDGIAVEMLTSGTTGPQKRIRLSYADLERSLRAAGRHYGGGPEGPRLRSGVAIVSAPLVHMAGLFRTLLNLCDGRRIVLMERFRADEFVELVARHRPKAISLVPAAMRMVMELDPPAEAFASVQVATSGTAALPVDLQLEFERRYDVAVLPSYGATEFAGGVAGWTLALHREWVDRKRGSVGRAQPGREVRIVSPLDGAELPAGERGALEVRTTGGEWVRTTDLGRVDEDGFVWIDGRSDDAIIRGGFKVLPPEIVDALRLHPAVLDAGASGIADERLGAVPVAAVEIRAGQQATVDELIDHLRAHLPPYKVPAHLRIVDELPRTSSLKVDQTRLRSLFVEVAS